MFKRPIPPGLQKGEKPRRFSQITHTFWYWLRFVKKSAIFWGKPERLLVQHSRNFSASVVASESKHFQSIKHLVDIGGGSGVFAIPLALRYPQLRISLMELSRVVPNIESFLRPYGVTDRVSLVGHDMHKTPWPLMDCDAFLFANILHFCDDTECLNLLRESFRLLPTGGRVMLHEMLWNEQKTGPLVTAYWNFWLISVSAGRQRTEREFVELLVKSGFSEPVVEKTLGGFSLLVSHKR
jgi:acetylserotonin N-methyltransferase